MKGQCLVVSEPGSLTVKHPVYCLFNYARSLYSVLNHLRSVWGFKTLYSVISSGELTAYVRQPGHC